MAAVGILPGLLAPLFHVLSHRPHDGGGPVQALQLSLFSLGVPSAEKSRNSLTKTRPQVRVSGLDHGAAARRS
ncbi:hypothetical protein BG653_04750 [Streptomyces platensis]|uniref:Uncharacterized protein n=1 Tax=Streptomyces platensis TaxID=58346 RepID=A0ABX3XSZ6_STRPT|nr:hypothetical protein BG653_04750 [Streptomyces platensis]